MKKLNLIKGKTYKRFTNNGARKSFSFGEEIGEFIEILPSGFYMFKLSKGRESLINPHYSYFEEHTE